MCPLDKFNIHSLSFIIIEHELEVLKGAIQTLTPSRPNVFIEIRTHNFAKVVFFCISIRYKDKNWGFDGKS